MKGRCGPKFGNGRCNKCTADYAIFCNVGTGWCGTTEEHMNAQAGDEYDFNSSACGMQGLCRFLLSK